MLVAISTWKKPTATHTERAHQLVIYPSAMAVRAEQWNTYCNSLTNYPSQVAPLPDANGKAMARNLALVTKTA
eukprot:3554773-Lingulodinium_polyedra.AAC.1